MHSTRLNKSTVFIELQLFNVGGKIKAEHLYKWLGSPDFRYPEMNSAFIDSSFV
jgi:hypothetical protein